MNKIYVIAGNEKEAKEWIFTDAFRRFGAGETSASLSDYVTVKEPKQFTGTKEPHGVFIGTFRNRKDIKDVLANLIVRYELNQTPESVTKLYREIYGV
jgi:hypothetical protein